MLSLLTGLGAPIPTQQETINLITEKKPAIVQQVKPELTVEEKIAQNYYKCNTDTQWIWASDATCHDKQPEVVQVTTQAQSTPRQAVNASGNGYPAGQCTNYAKSRRPDLPNNLGDSINWVYNAARQGFATGSTPKAGAIGQKGMHVVYIESVNSDGTVYLSERNFDFNGGFRYRTASASDFTYIY